MGDDATRAEVRRVVEAEHAAWLASDANRVLAANWLAGLNAAVAHHPGDVFPLLVRAAADACRPWAEALTFRVGAVRQEQERAGDRVAELAARVDELRAMVAELLEALGTVPG